MPYFLILVLLGIAPAVIAYGKGRNFALWWIYGALLAPVAFIHALMLQKAGGSAAIEKDTDYDRGNPDSPVPLMLKCGAIVLIAFTAYIGYRAMIGPETEMAQKPDAVAAVRPALPPEAPQSGETQKEASASMPANAGVGAAAPQQDLLAPAPKAAMAASASDTGKFVTSIPNVDETMPRTDAEITVADNRPEAEPQPVPVALAPENSPSASENDSREPAGSEPATNSDVTAVGEIVRMVQEALTKRGYDPGALSGRADARTRDAIRKFQADQNLQLTGAIDYAVLKALDLVGPRVYAFKRPPDIPPER